MAGNIQYSFAGRLLASFRDRLKNNIILIALIFISVIFAIISPVFLSTDNIVNILRQSAIVAVLGLGMTFVIICAEIDISVGSVMALTGIVMAITMRAGYGGIPAIAAGLLLGLIIGATNGFFTVYFEIPSFIVTLGMLASAEGLALILSNNRPVIINDNLFLSIFSGNIHGIPIIVIWMVILAVLSHIFLSKTRFGRHVYATGDDETAAKYTGIGTGRVKIITLTLSGLFAAIAAMLLMGRFQVARPTMGAGIELAVIAAVIIGGTSLFGGEGWIVGTILGAVFLSIIRDGLIINGFNSSYVQFIRGIIIILALVVRIDDNEGSWL